MDLIEAVKKNKPVVTRRLLEKGANPNMVEDWGKVTPLHFAVVYNSKKVIPVLLSAGADLKAKDFDGLTPRDCAISIGNEEIASLVN